MLLCQNPRRFALHYRPCCGTYAPQSLLSPAVGGPPGAQSKCGRLVERPAGPMRSSCLLRPAIPPGFCPAQSHTACLAWPPLAPASCPGGLVIYTVAVTPKPPPRTLSGGLAHHSSHLCAPAQAHPRLPPCPQGSRDAAPQSVTLIRKRRIGTPAQASSDYSLLEYRLKHRFCLQDTRKHLPHSTGHHPV